MTHFTTAKMAALIVSAVGIMVMMGWMLDIDILKSIMPEFVTMKFSTALSFLLSGITLYFIVRSLEGDSGIAQVVLPITTLIILLLMATLLISVLVGVRTGIEDLFVRDGDVALR